MTGTLMPPTALPTLTPQEIADLLAFLSAHPDHHEE